MKALTPERIQKKAHALTLRKQGWTEQRIAIEIGIPQQTISDWLTDNHETDIIGKKIRNTDNPTRNIIGKQPSFLSFCGNIENFQPENNVKFPLIIAANFTSCSFIGGFTVIELP